MPTRRLAHFLRARHDAACLARDLRVWETPDVVTSPEMLVATSTATGQRATTARWLDPGHGLIVWEQIVRRDVDLRSVLLPSGLGTSAQQSWELLHAYRIPVRVLHEDAARKSSHSAAGRSNSAVGWSRAAGSTPPRLR